MPRVQQRLGTKLRQGLSVNLKNSIKLLTYSNIELIQKIEDILQINPFIEEKENFSVYNGEDPEEHRRRESTGSGNYIDNVISSGDSLQEYLIKQSGLLNTGKEERKLCEALISSIDDKGYTSLPHMDIAASLGFNKSDLNRVLEYVKNFDPCGVCAENVWQSLEWQIEKLYDNDITMLDILHVLKESSHENEISDQINYSEAISNYLKINNDIVSEKLTKIKSLDIYPGRTFHSQKNMIYPELIIEEKDGNYEIRYYHSMIPELVLNADLFKQFMKAEKKGERKNEFNQKFLEAKDFLQSIIYRKKILLKVAAAIVDIQQKFFMRGSNELIPMSLKDVSQKAGVHISTVSRVVSDKYCQTSRGLFPLKYFFKKKVANTGDKDVGQTELMDKIQEVIGAEDHYNPLSDEKITQILKNEGWSTKRRTVNKYRKLLHIPPQKERKVQQKELIDDLEIYL